MALNFPGRALLGIALAASLTLSACRGEGDANNETDTMPATMSDTGAKAPDTAAIAPTPATATATMSDANIVAKLAAMDSAEIELGRLGVEKAQHADVRAYAQMMIDHHTQMSSEAAALARQEGITPLLAADDPTSREMATASERLTSTEAVSFDRAYMDQMVADHQKTLATMSSMAGMARRQTLRAHIEEGLPREQAHLDHALKVLQDIAGTAAAR